jgi:hypothetical protein
MGLMEEWGSGYKRVIHACQSGRYPEPDWQELGTAFRVIFYPHPAVLDPSRADVPVNNRQHHLFCPTGFTGLFGFYCWFLTFLMKARKRNPPERQKIS